MSSELGTYKTVRTKTVRTILVLILQVKVLKTFHVVPSSLGSRAGVREIRAEHGAPKYENLKNKYFAEM